MARESNAWASQDSDSDDYEDEDEESYKEVYPVCRNCHYYYWLTGYCSQHAVILDTYKTDTHGCDDFSPKK